MALDLGVGEKFKQEFEPGLAGNQGRKNGRGGGVKKEEWERLRPVTHSAQNGGE